MVVEQVKLINKTIVITYDDATRMIDFCKNSENHVSKEFYDWYLVEKGEYFATTGMLIVDNILGKDQRAAISFDFTDPDNVLFSSYVYQDQSKICSWTFKRQENLTMEKATFDITYLSLNNLKKNDLLCPPDIKEVASDTAKMLTAGYNRKGFRKTAVKDILDKTLHEGLKGINKITCENFIYFTYALMYYVSKQEPEEITSFFHKQLDAEGRKIKTTYKYSGYIDLRENKTYKPIIEKDPNEPVREYQRHIQKWTVRGHYRKINGQKVWVQPHTKGHGELEKRIYGTEDERDLNLVPKVFEVERAVKESQVKFPIIEPKETPEVIPQVARKTETKLIKKNIWQRFLSYLKRVYDNS